MKITVNQLRRIIKEEVQRTLREGYASPKTYDELVTVVKQSFPDALFSESDLGEITIENLPEYDLDELLRYLGKNARAKGNTVFTGMTSDVNGKLMPSDLESPPSLNDSRY